MTMQLRKVRNVHWVQSQAGWTKADVTKALADAESGRDYHTERPTLGALRG